MLRKLEGKTNKNFIELKSVPVVVVICVICENFVVGVVVVNVVSVVVIAEVFEGAFLFVN